MNKNEALQMSIKQLAEKHDWTKHDVNSILAFVHKCETRISKSLPIAEQQEKQRLLDDLQANTTLLQLVEKLEAEYSENSYGFSQKYLSFFKKFKAVGLTRLDSIIIPQNTVTIEMLKGIPKEELMQIDARILGTISDKTLKHYGEDVGRFPGPRLLPYPTLERVLEIGPYSSMTKKTINETAAALSVLGLKEEGKLFIHAETRSTFVEMMVKEEGLKPEVAALIAPIAERRGWK